MAAVELVDGVGVPPGTCDVVGSWAWSHVGRTETVRKMSDHQTRVGVWMRWTDKSNRRVIETPMCAENASSKTAEDDRAE